MKFTNTFWRNIDAKKRYVFNQGGTWSGKTYGELQKEILIAMNRKVHTSCMAETVPHLRMGMIKDFTEIMVNDNLFDPKAWNKTDSMYIFPNGSVIEFFSADNAGKVHGGRRDRLLVNEIQNIKFDIFRQAAMRTKEQITCDFNPTSVFWAHNNYIENKEYSDQVEYIHSTYKDNPYIPEEVKKDILTMAEIDPNYKRVYIEGLPGTLEGLIFEEGKDWFCIDEMPKEFKWYCYGLDFGYVNDPTALIKVGFVNGVLYIDELVYETGLLNVPSPNGKDKNICERFEQCKVERNIDIIYDRAEEKSGDEIKARGWRMEKAIKWDIKTGLDILKRYPKYVTNDSVNVKKELRNYRYKDKKAIKSINQEVAKENEPIDAFNHTLDPLRYIVERKIGKPRNVLC